jgi:hypothetical protein
MEDNFPRILIENIKKLGISSKKEVTELFKNRRIILFQEKGGACVTNHMDEYKSLTVYTKSCRIQP